jgi:hypothetical protein
MAFDLPESAHALRVVRCNPTGNNFVYYEAITFPENPRGICDMYLRRASVCGRIAPNVESNYVIDILDANADTVAEFPAERKAARYLIEKLKLRVVRDWYL